MNAILYNGNIYPQYRVNRRPSLVVISGRRIAEVGSDLKAARSRYPRHRLINLKGRTVLPGLVDYWVGDVDVAGIHEFVGNAINIPGQPERILDLRGEPLPGKGGEDDA